MGRTFGMQDIIKHWPNLCLLPMCTSDGGLSIVAAGHPAGHVSEIDSFLPYTFTLFKEIIETSPQNNVLDLTTYKFQIVKMNYLGWFIKA